MTGVILPRMKTAISIRDDVFDSAERMAKSMGISRSELYTRAVKDYVSRHSGDRITERLDAVYGADPDASALDDTLACTQAVSLDEEESMTWGEPVTPDLVRATWLGGHRVHLEFEDGCAGVLNMGGRRWRGVFEPLQDVAVFRQFRLDRELNTIAWPTGADLAPEYLYEQALKNPAPGTDKGAGQGPAKVLSERADGASLVAPTGGSSPPEVERSDIAGRSTGTR